MAILEKNIIDVIEILENNTIQIRNANIIEKDGVEIARTYHRQVINPLDDITNQDEKVKTIANAIWTEDVVNAYKALIAKPDVTETQPNN